MANMTHTHLCVGGPLAGQRHASQSPDGFILGIQTSPDDGPGCAAPSETVEYQNHVYRSQSFATGADQRMTFWVPAAQDFHTTLEKLAAGYSNGFRS